VRRLQAVLLCFALLGGLAAVAQARTPKAKNGAIAFSAKRGGTRAIFTREPNGANLRLVPTQGRADQPAVSPRGLRLAFTRYGSTGSQIWITYLDGTGLRQLTSGRGDAMPAWSAAGDQVVFAGGARGRRDLYSIVADGSGLRRLTTSSADDHSPDWAKNGRIAFVRGKRVYSLNPGSGAARRLTGGRQPDASPAWSPSGKTLVFVRGKAGRRDLYTLTADGKHKRRLTAIPGDETAPAFSPDGTRVAFAHTRGGKRRLYLAKVKGRTITKLPARRGLRARRLTSSRSASAAPSWQPTGLPPVLAAGGDVACSPSDPSFNGGEGRPGFCRQRMTSDLMLRSDLSAVLAVGDLQYERGELQNFQAAYDPSWGRLKALTRPVPGNHEYGTPAAAGYFDYFNGPGAQTGQAGDRDKGYYSFDVGSWHVVALNSECRQVGGCGPESPQVRWFEQDLAAHPAACTLAYWHRPRFTSGRNDDKGDMAAAWNSAYAGNVDLVLAGHEHFYERFGPQTPEGVYDPVRGIRELVVGIGGRSRHAFIGVAPNSEYRDNSTLGVAELTLREGGYDWRLVAAPSGRVPDSGSGACH